MFSTIQIVRFTSPSPLPLAAVLKRITFMIAMLTHKELTYHQPGYLSELIVEYRPVYHLRSVDNSLLVISQTKRKIDFRAFRVSAPTIWNSLPLSVRCTTTTSSFRSQLKTLVWQRVWLIIDFRKADGAPLTHCTVGNSTLRRTLNYGAPPYKFD